MDTHFKLPVRFNENYEIVDAQNKVVVPSIIWASDVYHLERQKRVGLMIQDLINGWKFNKPIQHEGVLDEVLPEPDLEEVVKASSVTKRHWFKGMKTSNPFGRKGNDAH